METVTLGSMLTDFGTVFTSIVSYFTDVLDIMVSHPLLLLTLGVTFTSVIIALVKKFIY